MRYVSILEYLMGRAKVTDLSDEQMANMNRLVPKVNDFLEAFGSYRKVNSGLRTPEANKAAGGKKKSNHLICAAIDLEDADGKLYDFAMTNTEILEKLELWCEHRMGGWLHMQIFPPKSGKRFFMP